MGLTSVFTIVALIGAGIAVGGFALMVNNLSQNRSARGGLLLVPIGAVIAVVFFVISSSLVEIGPNEVGVVFQRIGGNAATNNLIEQPLTPGVHIVIPVFNDVIVYSTEARTYTMSSVTQEGQVQRSDGVDARTRDGQEVTIDVSIIYAIDAKRVNQLHLTWQNRYQDEFVRPVTRSTLRDNIAAYSITDIYGGTGTVTATDSTNTANKIQEISTQVTDKLSKVFAENGLILRQFLLRAINPSEEFKKAVESKQVAQQQAEQALQEANRARTIAQGQADAAVTVAKGDSDATAARAKGEADAIKLRAAADAEALALINAQLKDNPQLLQWRYIDKLAPEIKMILLPSNSPYLFNLDSLTGGTSPSATATPKP